jgi:hypothetical protein
MQMRNDTAGFVQVLLRDLGGVRPLSATISVLFELWKQHQPWKIVPKITEP